MDWEYLSNKKRERECERVRESWCVLASVGMHRCAWSCGNVWCHTALCGIVWCCAVARGVARHDVAAWRRVHVVYATAHAGAAARWPAPPHPRQQGWRLMPVCGSRAGSHT